MSDPISHVEATHAPTSTDPTTAGATNSSNNVTAATTIKSVGDLKKKSPKVYQAMMEGIGMNICRSMQRHQARLKKMMAEGRANARQS